MAKDQLDNNIREEKVKSKEKKVSESNSQKEIANINKKWAKDIKQVTETKTTKVDDTKIKNDKKESKKKQITEQKTEAQATENEKLSDSKTETKIQEKAEKTDLKEKKTEKKIKKTEAVVNQRDVRISTKHAVAVCNFIRNKEIDQALRELEEVKKFRKAIPMKGEIPHKKGMMSGRYPIKAVVEFIKLLKSLRANAIYNEIEFEKFKIFCMANIASKPYKRFGQRRFKRSHVQIKLIPVFVIK